jgi:dTDP-4-amino-4,6-dideoxygalactose transaminase
LTGPPNTVAAPDRRPIAQPQRDVWVPFNRSALSGDELAYLHDSIERGHISGNGVYTRRCEELLSGLLEGARVLLTTSCTHALEMAALLLEVGPGDEVIVPSFTFVSTANAFALRGARIVFADIRPDTLNLDERCLPSLLSPRTKVIVPVHYGGVACDMDAILALSAKSGVAVVEDNAHGLFGSYRGRPLGTLGVTSALSFHATKNITCGEGGALVLNDPALAERAEILREKGTDRSRFFRGEVDRYTWLDVGSSYVLSDMLAAVLLAQLERRDSIQAARYRVWRAYYDGLGDWTRRRDVQLPQVPADRNSSYHVFHLLMPSADERRDLIKHLRDHGVQAVFHYLPLHISPMGQSFGGRPGDCPVAEAVSDRIVRLPLFATMTDREQARVVAAVRSF